MIASSKMQIRCLSFYLELRYVLNERERSLFAEYCDSIPTDDVCEHFNIQDNILRNSKVYVVFDLCCLYP